MESVEFYLNKTQKYKMKSAASKATENLGLRYANQRINKNQKKIIEKKIT